jgi:hypothetical protein
MTSTDFRNWPHEAHLRELTGPRIPSLNGAMPKSTGCI